MSLKEDIKKAQKLRSKWINFNEVLNDKGKKNVKSGTVLGFKQDDGTVIHYKFIHINRKSNKYYAIELGHLYDYEELLEKSKPTDEVIDEQA